MQAMQFLVFVDKFSSATSVLLLVSPWLELEAARRLRPAVGKK